MRQAVNSIEAAKPNETVADKDVDVVVDGAAAVELEDKTEQRLNDVFSGKGVQEEAAEKSEKSDDSTLEKSKEKPEEKSDVKVDSTPEEKPDTEVVEKPEIKAVEKDTEVESQATDADADKGSEKKKDVTPLSDAYYRAAIHRGWKPEEIEAFYESKPDLCVKTLGNIYEAVKRSNEEFATLGRAYKERSTQEATATVTATSPEAKKTEYKSIDFEALEKTDIDPDTLAALKAQDVQGKITFDMLQEIQGAKSVQSPTQPSYVAGQSPRVIAQETALIQQQIENFFDADELKLYSGFYGDIPKDAKDWGALSPGQKANRWAVIEMMDDLMAGAHMNHRDMEIDEAMQLAHLNISESQREKVIREKLKADVTKRGNSLTLKPSGAAKSDSTNKPQTPEELIETTQERLNKVFN
ncbi:hypothetical protein LCGC14_0359880 [marine sediment metagenome]|uniref:Uncharacterized protein n=1 Tax=marine sediment metagenome TaxID=412755 RepID=A0A0F9TE27_9ZZZZ